MFLGFCGLFTFTLNFIPLGYDFLSKAFGKVFLIEENYSVKSFDGQSHFRKLGQILSSISFLTIFYDLIEI